MQIDTDKIQAMFDYLSRPTEPLQKADGLFVFGRKNPLVALKAAELYKGDFARYAMITGGVGKDSGDLVPLGIPESVYLGVLSMYFGIPGDDLLLERDARNGGENGRNGIKTILESGRPYDTLIVVTHATQLNRNLPMLEFIANELGFNTKLQGIPTDYRFEPDNFIDQREAALEILRIHEWPAKNLMAKQEHLPIELAGYASELREYWKSEGVLDKLPNLK